MTWTFGRIAVFTFVSSQNKNTLRYHSFKISMGKSSSVFNTKQNIKRFKVMPDSNSMSTIFFLQESQKIMNGFYFTQRAFFLLMTTGKQSI